MAALIAGPLVTAAFSSTDDDNNKPEDGKDNDDDDVTVIEELPPDAVPITNLKRAIYDAQMRGETATVKTLQNSLDNLLDKQSKSLNSPDFLASESRKQLASLTGGAVYIQRQFKRKLADAEAALQNIDDNYESYKTQHQATLKELEDNYKQQLEDAAAQLTNYETEVVAAKIKANSLIRELQKEFKK